MKVSRREYHSEDFARGFVEGVELANDGALEAHEPVVEVMPAYGRVWAVYCHDADDHETAYDVPECPVCGAKST